MRKSDILCALQILYVCMYVCVCVCMIVSANRCYVTNGQRTVDARRGERSGGGFPPPQLWGPGCHPQKNFENIGTTVCNLPLLLLLLILLPPLPPPPAIENLYSPRMVDRYKRQTK